jgi:hypothetical protein
MTSTTPPAPHVDAAQFPTHDCPRCATHNRDEARYCKGCGDRLALRGDPFRELVGMVAIGDAVRNPQAIIDAALVNGGPDNATVVRLEILT